MHLEFSVEMRNALVGESVQTTIDKNMCIYYDNDGVIDKSAI